MALQPSIRVINGKVFGAYAAQAKNVAYGQGTVEDALDDLNESVDAKIDVSRRILTSVSWQTAANSNLSFFNIPNVGSGFAPIAKIVNSDGSFTVYGFLYTGFFKATFDSSGVYQSSTKIG